MRYFLSSSLYLFCFLFILPIFSHAFGQYGFQPSGIFGGATCTDLRGWTCDSDNYTQSLTVDIYKDGPAGGGGIFVGSQVANFINSNSTAFCGGTSNHGFIFPVPDSLKDTAPHDIYVYAHDHPSGTIINPLNSSPRTITCSQNISGAIFADYDLDEVFSSGDTWVSGGTVTISPASAISYPTSVSYSASNLSAGVYNVYYTPPSGYEPFYPNNNGNNPFYTVAVGNSCSTDTTHGSVCDASGNITALRFALRKIYTISGNVFIDSNRDGIKDPLEQNYSGGVVNLTGDATDQKTTGALGNFSFPNLFGGAYTATLTVPSGYVPTTPNPPTGSTTLP